MKILHIGKYFSPFKGGVEYVTQSVVEYCASLGHQIRVLVHQHNDAAVQPLNKNYQVTRVPTLFTLLFTPIAPRFVYFLRRELKLQPDLIHIHMPNPSAFWLLLLPSARKAKCVVHWHSDVIDEQASWALRLAYMLYRPFEHWLLKNADVIICTSPDYAHYSMALAPFSKKVQVVPLGIDQQQVRTIAEQIPNNDLNLLTVGRLTYYKGHRYLLEAISQLKRQNIEVTWTVVGTGEQEQALKKQVRAFGLLENIKFLGRLSDESLEKEFARCDVFCLPSIERTEAFGVVLLEAMRAGKPCIVTDVPGSGMNYVVENMKTGLVVKRKSSQALADACQWLVKNPDKRLELGVAGQKRQQKSFSTENVNKQILEIYQQLR